MVKLKYVARDETIFQNQKVREFLLENVGNRSEKILNYRIILILLLLANLVGSLYGYSIYLQQLEKTPLLLWMFVPDSPLMATLFLYFLLDKSRAWINAWIIVGSVKAFIFTFLVIFFLSDFVVDTEITLIAHIFQIFQAMFFVLPVLVKQLSKRNFVLACIITILPDISDFFLDTIPKYPNYQAIIPLTVIGYILSNLIFISLLWLLLPRNSLDFDRKSTNRDISVV